MEKRIKRRDFLKLVGATLASPVFLDNFKKDEIAIGLAFPSAVWTPKGTYDSEGRFYRKDMDPLNPADACLFLIYEEIYPLSFKICYGHFTEWAKFCKDNNLTLEYPVMKAFHKGVWEALVYVADKGKGILYFNGEIGLSVDYRNYRDYRDSCPYQYGVTKEFVEYYNANSNK